MTDSSDTPCPPHPPASPATASSRMATMLAAGALLGKVFGLAREIMMARVFGASLVTDGFRGSLTAVLVPLAPLQSEGVPSVIIPMHHAWQKDVTAPRRMAALCVGLTLVAVVLMLVIQACGIWWVRLFLGGMPAEGQALAAQFIRVMALWMPSSVLITCLGAAEVATGRSRITAIRSAFLNVFVMAGIVLYIFTGTLLFMPVMFALSFNVLGIWGVWRLTRDGTLDPGGMRPALVMSVLSEFVTGMRPLMGQPLVEQSQVWLERLIVSGFAVGTLAAIDYSRTLTDSAVLLVSQPVGLAVLYMGATSDPKGMILMIAKPLLAVAIPVSTYLVLFAPDIVRLIFARGAFDERAVMLTSGSLRGIAIGLWATTLGMILLRFLNTAGRNRHAAIILASAFATNAMLNVAVWHMPDVGSNASFLIGLGEAMRGLVLLAGVAIALEVGRPVLGLIGRTLPSVVLLSLLALEILSLSSPPLTRLALGGTALAAAIALALALIMPREAKRYARRVVQKAMAFRRRSGP